MAEAQAPMQYSLFLIGLAGGLAGTAHCVGMCGGFALHLSRAAGYGSAALRQALYIAGKTFTYAFLGALSGALGHSLVQSQVLPGSQKGMAIVAGASLLIFGLAMLGVRLPAPLAGRLNALEWGFVRSIYRQCFTDPGPVSSFGLGLATGFLPCPMTLAMLALAAGSHSVVHGILILAGLGIGTAPGLVGVGVFGNLVGARWRRIGLRPAGVIVVLLGVVTIARTQAFIHRGCHAPGGVPASAPACAHCQELGHTCPHCAAKQHR